MSRLVCFNGANAREHFPEWTWWNVTIRVLESLIRRWRPVHKCSKMILELTRCYRAVCGRINILLLWLPSPSAVKTAPGGMWDAFQDAHPPHSSPFSGFVLVGYWAAVRWLWSYKPGIWPTDYSETHRMAGEDQAPVEAFFHLLRKNRLITVYSTSTWRLVIVWEADGLGSLVKASVCS